MIKLKANAKMVTFKNVWVNGFGLGDEFEGWIAIMQTANVVNTKCQLLDRFFYKK